jgi:hypothetical protein
VAAPSAATSAPPFAGAGDGQRRAGDHAGLGQAPAARRGDQGLGDVDRLPRSTGEEELGGVEGRGLVGEWAVGGKVGHARRQVDGVGGPAEVPQEQAGAGHGR